MSQITVLNKANVSMGAFTRTQVAEKLQTGEITLDNLAFVEGLTQWTPLRDVLARVDAILPPPVSAFPGAPPVASPLAYSYAVTMQPPGHLVYAGFWLRFVAIFLDGLIVGIPMSIIGMIIGGFYGYNYGMAHPGHTLPFFDEDGGISGPFLQLEITVSIISLFVKWLYYALQESSPAQATVGKRVMGIKVTNLEGQRIGFGQASGRFFGKLISSAILCIGFMMAGFTERKQALHDMIAGTLVVRE